MTKGKKNKRGARGSTEEEIKSPKRANMATESTSTEPILAEAITDKVSTSVLDETNPTESISTEDDLSSEPTLAELREMLVDIQINISSIRRENKNFRKDMEELKATVRAQNTEIATLKTSLANITKQCVDIESELTSAKKTVNEQEEEIAELYELQDSLEQYTRKNSLEIHGIPENAYTTTEEVVLKLAEALNVPVNPHDIEISHKLKRKSNKPIIVKFVSHKVKTNLYRARTKLKNVSVSSLFPSLSAAGRAGSNRIYLNENLTSYRRKIVNRANAMRNDGLLLSVWTMDGKIYVKTSPEGRPTQISELEDLEYI